MMPRDEMVKKMMNTPGVKAEDDSLAEGFSLFNELIKVLQRCDLWDLRTGDWVPAGKGSWSFRHGVSKPELGNQ